MNVAARLALFAAVVALVFGGAFAVGRAIDPDPAAERAPSHAAERAPPHAAEREASAEHDRSPGGHR